MQYPNFSLEQIMSKKYQELCNLFLGLTNDDQIKTKLEHILYEGSYKEYNISSKIVNKDNPDIEIERRASLAYLLIRNPETFDKLVENQVNIFHGTNANALPSILKYGLNSVDKSEEIGIDVSTGEKWSRIQGKRNFVSFTDVLDTAEYYSAINSEEKNDKLSFEVVIGTTVKDVMATKICRVSSDVPEVAVENSFPKERIKMILVPSNKIEFVKKIINNDEIEVLPMDGINEKFYYMDDFSGINIFPDNYEKLKKQLQKNYKKFSLREIKELMVNIFSKKINKNIEGEQLDAEYRQR